ncbi:MAG: hypothetical protein JW963_22570 [Anaerolineales bacterium]|nr:hypothetical protein [Anaerolineales bacterium]
MQRLTLLTIIILISIAACAPVTALPIETATAIPTTTATPAPTGTPTPTLEPWMEALPGNVASVEIDGEEIFGLDSQGSRVMEYSLDSGEWLKIIEQAQWVPEGFAIGEAGLLRDPATGKDVLVLNQEVDWEAVRTKWLTGLYESGRKWNEWSGEPNDATKYESAEEWIAAVESAPAGTKFTIVLPRRTDLSRLDPEMEYYEQTYDDRNEAVSFDTVQADLSRLTVQVVDADRFKTLTGGMDWADPLNPAFSLIAHKLYVAAFNAVMFGVNEQGEVVMTVGSYSFTSDIPLGRKDYYIGRFGGDGLGDEAEQAASQFVGLALDMALNLPKEPIKGIYTQTADGSKLVYFSAGHVYAQETANNDQVKLFEFAEAK